MDAERLSIHVASDGGVATATLAGELDIVTAEECKRRLNAASDAGASLLRLEMERLGFVDSSGLGALVAVHHHAVAAGTKVELTGVSDQLRRLMQITRLDELFTLR